jgi:hypothetical protein
LLAHSPIQASVTDRSEWVLGAKVGAAHGVVMCVTGKITTYRGVPEIVAGEREQIEVQK